jgi:hypothetical protein
LSGSGIGVVCNTPSTLTGAGGRDIFDYGFKNAGNDTITAALKLNVIVLAAVFAPPLPVIIRVGLIASSTKLPLASGGANTAANTITFNFSAAIKDGSFTVDDIGVTNGTINSGSFTKVSETQYTVTSQLPMF